VLVGDLVAFVASRDLAISDRFYGDLLGLRLVESSAFANVYDVGGTTLRVTRVDELAGARYTVLGWRVSDITASIEALRAAGVKVERYDDIAADEHGVWTAPGGSRIAWFTDPDGNVLSLQQAPTDGAPQAGPGA
jgi:catechol 2,3-dioxygenase-like lactoylglutathione lyase family enzyme